MRTVGVIFRAEFRRRWRSWLALAVLIAVVSGVVLAAAAAGNRTAGAYPAFLARHGYNGVAVNDTAVPQIVRLPELASVVTVPVAFNGQPRCACTHPIDALDLSVYYLPAPALARTVNLVAGRLPNEADPDEVLASFNMTERNGIHVGSVITMPFYAASQAQAVYSAPGLGPVPTGPTLTLHVVGIEAAEYEFPAGTTPSYGLYTTTAFARTVLPSTTTGYMYLLKTRPGVVGSQRLKADAAALGVTQMWSLDTPGILVAGGIHPQAVGWWILALLAAIAGIAVVGQALSRQRAVESEDYPTLQALGTGSRALVQLGMSGTLVVAAAGALGAIAVAYFLSPIAPLGEARYAEASTGLSFDAATIVLGAVAVVAVVVLLGLWPAVRATRRDAEDRRTRPSATADLLAGAGAPVTAVIGVRHALERGRGPRGVPVGSTLLGTILAVAALCGTAIFSTSLTTLTNSPHLYGDDYQAIVYAQSPGRPDQDPLISRLEHSSLVAAVTVGTGGSFNAAGVRFTVFATQAVRGPLLLSAVTGRLPAAPDEIALGVTTLRAVGAKVGSTIRLTGQQSGPSPWAVSRFRVVGTVALPTGVAQDQAGMGTGGAMTLAGFFSAECPAGPGQRACTTAARQKVQAAAFIRAVPGRRGAAAIAHLVSTHPDSASAPVPPTGLVNFGEAVNFPLIFGLLLALFGVATLAHLLVVSVARRRHEMGLLKALGFVNRQVGAAVYWQATTVAIIGILTGVPLGVSVGRTAWRAFAINIGVVPLPVVDVAMVAAVGLGVLVAGGLLASVPAVVAGRTNPGALLRTQ